MPDGHRPLFDRVGRLVRELHPDAELVRSYDMPTWTAGGRRFHVGVWKHGVSFYGFGAGDDGGFLARHPELQAHRSTIRLTPADAEGVTDDELRALITLALG
jgi:hypothetical protein